VATTTKEKVAVLLEAVAGIYEAAWAEEDESTQRRLLYEAAEELGGPACGLFDFVSNGDMPWDGMEDSNVAEQYKVMADWLRQHS
jgi:hypothetical protein